MADEAVSQAAPGMRQKATRVIHHILDGAVEMYHVDANHALGFKKEWRAKPWSEKEIEAYKAKQDDAAE